MSGIPKPTQDPRWLRLNDRDWVCGGCGSKHAGVFDLVCSKPDAWPGSDDWSENVELLNSNHILTEDFCVLNGEHFFVRCVVQLPILVEPGATFGFGVWSTLSKRSFDLYVETFDSGEQGDLGPWFGWFSNHLKGYPDTFNLKCQVHPRAARQRPLIELEPTEHPLAIEQRDGITFDRLLEIYALNGHDMRAALSD
jgi:hypothetical protein